MKYDRVQPSDMTKKLRHLFHACSTHEPGRHYTRSTLFYVSCKLLQGSWLRHALDPNTGRNPSPQAITSRPREVCKPIGYPFMIHISIYIYIYANIHTRIHTIDLPIMRTFIFIYTCMCSHAFAHRILLIKSVHFQLHEKCCEAEYRALITRGSGNALLRSESLSYISFIPVRSDKAYI